MLESDMEHAYTCGSNADMTATDTQKNTVYYVAKQCSKQCTVEEYALALAKHFVKTYPKVTTAKISVEQAPWKRVNIKGLAHKHGFVAEGTETRTVKVTAHEGGSCEVIPGLKNFRVLKTTQSGYEGYLRDRYTLLPETKDRILATSVTATWKYKREVDYDAAYEATKEAISEAFWGPAASGVYSPSVQFTLFEMAKAVLQRVAAVESIYFNMPNLHFLPCSPVTSKFENDVYIATSEPSGNIEATVGRGTVHPHCKL